MDVFSLRQESFQNFKALKYINSEDDMKYQSTQNVKILQLR